MGTDPETTRKRQRHKVTLNFPSWERRELPEGAYKVAVQRTAHLAARSFSTTPEDIAVSAYMQGIEDCAQVFFRRGIPLPAYFGVPTDA